MGAFVEGSNAFLGTISDRVGSFFLARGLYAVETCAFGSPASAGTPRISACSQERKDPAPVGVQRSGQCRDGGMPDDTVSQAPAPKVIGVRCDELSTVSDLGAFFFGTLPYDRRRRVESFQPMR